METVILVSVLSTLGVVALVGTLVVMFKKLNNKVDVNENENIYRELESTSNRLNQGLEDISRSLYKRIEENERISDSMDTSLSLDLNKRIDELDNATHRRIDELSNGIHSTIDSRCDKLYDLIPKEVI
jgi:hypothetical protein